VLLYQIDQDKIVVHIDFHNALQSRRSSIIVCEQFGRVIWGYFFASDFFQCIIEWHLMLELPEVLLSYLSKDETLLHIGEEAIQ
jgi:hypothetical protein